MFRRRLGGDSMWNEFDRLRRGMDNLYTALGTGTRPASDPWWREARLFPLLNITREGSTYIVTAELPGVSAKDMEISVEGETLTLKGERKPTDLGETVSYHRRERTSGRFQRSMALPHRIDSEKVVATYKDGVLTVTLPIEQAALPRQIAVTSD